jgi:AmiR/NasT family two-component response regulator
VTSEDSVLEEVMDNLREAAQRIRATQNLMHARGMTEDENYRELLMRHSTALAIEGGCSYVEARRRREL